MDDAPRVLLRGEETAGQIAVVYLGGGGRPPLHKHDFDETFYVAEGEITFQLGDELATCRAGEVAVAPRGVPHTYANLSGAPARVFMVITPAGFERYFARMRAEREGIDPPDWALQSLPAVTTLGPPIGGEVTAKPTQEQDRGAIARSIVDANRFMALGTSDASGTPWVSPVWYAPLSYREYVWVSRPGTKHSRNVAERPQVAIAIYDSHRPGGWSAVYMAGIAEELEDVDAALEAFNRRSEVQGLRAWSRAEVVPPGEFRLYRATVNEQFVLDDHDSRLAVHLE
jgi:quercetin dioxygenase-like cupin family protein/nitroimidazol reductase NimA-like FMN-containing flavoprotein (pyridoxamine 5'-phosphate oxidase superfamily)